MAGLKQKVRLELVDGTEVEATYDGRDLRAWETRSGKPAIGIAMSLSMLTFLGWNAARREGSLNGSFTKYEEFDKACTWVQGVRDDEDSDEDAEARPTKRKTRKTTASTRKAAGDESSAP